MALKVPPSRKVISIDVPPVTLREAAEILLGAIIGQAFDDGMSGVRMGIRVDDETCYLFYFSDGSGKIEKGSWEMVPPPFHAYPTIFQALLKHATLDEGAVWPLKGKVSARRRWRALPVAFTASQLHEFTLTFERGGG